MHWSQKGCPHISDAEYLERLKSKLKILPSGCWEIQGFRHPEGYGAMSYRGKQLRAHKLMHMLTKGEIPSGKIVMHTCDNPPCCNPDHLELGTKADNNRDMFAKKRNVYNPARYTKCKNGHEFSPENTWICKQGFRHCRLCSRIKQRIAAGWPKELAETLPPTRHGYRPVGASYKNSSTVQKTWVFSTRGSAPRQRAWRARQKANRLAQANSTG
jgi:hypothetical protein